jgi:hypothetical protein
MPTLPEELHPFGYMITPQTCKGGQLPPKVAKIAYIVILAIFEEELAIGKASL